MYIASYLLSLSLSSLVGDGMIYITVPFGMVIKHLYSHTYVISNFDS